MEKVIGIDAGAWGASVAAVVDGSLRVFPGSGGSSRFPSMVAVDPEGAVFVSDSARRRAVIEPYSTILTPSVLLGRFPGDVVVRKALAHSPMQVVPGPAGHATICLADAVYAVPEIVAQLLAHMRALAEQDLGEHVQKAVLAVPQSYGDAQRQALMLAARLAGLQVVRLITSPSAAAIGYAYPSGVKKRWLVVDAGGSQTSAAVIDVHGRIVEVVGAAADSSLGVLHLDTSLCRVLSEEFERIHRVELEQNLTARMRLLFATESAKRSLGQHDQVRIRLREFLQTADGVVDFDGYLDRTTLEQTTQHYAEGVLAVADDALQAAGIGTGDVEGLLIVGGGSDLAILRRELQSLSGCEGALLDNPESVIAAGAAIYGSALLNNPSMAVEEVRMLSIDVMPADLTIATSGGYREVVIPAGARLPISAQRVFTTSQDGQTQVRILISQGVQGMSDAHARLGEFVLDGLKPGERGKVRINVGFEIDVNGLLHVFAHDLVTGHRTASDVRISLAVAEQALAAVCEARGMGDETIKNPVGGALPAARSRE